MVLLYTPSLEEMCVLYQVDDGSSFYSVCYSFLVLFFCLFVLYFSDFINAAVEG